MQRVAVDVDTWVRLVTCASGLSRTIQASLDKLALLMTEHGFVRSAVAKLRLITSRSKSTICEHLGAAQEAGWLTCVERGGGRGDDSVPSVYQATVPASVWERREELLAQLPVENPDQVLISFAPGDVVPGQPVSEAKSEYRSALIDQSLPSHQQQQPQQTLAPNPDRAEEPDLVAAVIEELAAHTSEVVDRAWAARVASQILGRRRIKHPLNYVIKSIQNAAHAGDIRVRFMPARPSTATDPRPEPRPALAAAEDQAPEVPPARQPLLGLAAWDRPDVPLIRAARVEDLPPAAPKRPVQPPLMSSVPAPPVTKQDLLAPSEPQTIYRPEKRLAGLGHQGATELARVRAAFAERQQRRLQEAMAG